MSKVKCISEAALQKKILKFLEPFTYVFKVIRSSRSGTPDIVCCLQGQFIAIEVKREDGVIEPLQKMHGLEIKKNRGLHFCVKPSNFDSFKATILELLDHECS